MLRALLALRRRRRPCLLKKQPVKEQSVEKQPVVETTCRETTCRRNNGSTGGYDDFDRRIFQETGSPAATQGGCRRDTCPHGISFGHIPRAGSPQGSPLHTRFVTDPYIAAASSPAGLAAASFPSATPHKHQALVFYIYAKTPPRHNTHAVCRILKDVKTFYAITKFPRIYVFLQQICEELQCDSFLFGNGHHRGMHAGVIYKALVQVFRTRDSR